MKSSFFVEDSQCNEADLTFDPSLTASVEADCVGQFEVSFVSSVPNSE